ncbi:MAG: tetratricopeptide repeat protein [Spirochaetes bacterium]|nr:tetratricopeptide repeat protein [Spirochaetota bacterium]
MTRYYRISVILLLTLAAATPDRTVISSPACSYEEEYFRHRKRGEFAEALESLRAWSIGLDDAASIAANLYRLRELVAYPELTDRALRTLDSIEAAAGPFEKDHADRIRAEQYRIQGDTRRADAIMDALAYLDFSALGPFSDAGDDEYGRASPSGKLPDFIQRATGHAPGDGWFPVAPDRTGTLDFAGLFPMPESPYFYLRRSFAVPRPGEYYLILGTSGRTDLWLDGARIFCDGIEHGFNHDQYFIRVILPPGPHRILLRACGSDRSIRVSFRIASVDGSRVKAQQPGPGGTTTPGTLIEAGYSPAVAALIKMNASDHDSRFLIGYLYYAMGFGNPGGRASEYLSSIPEDHPRCSCARLYLAQGAVDNADRDRLLLQSTAADPGNLESLRERVLLEIERGRIYEAAPLIEKIRRAAPASLRHSELMARLFVRTGPAEEAQRRILALKSSRYPSCGYRLGSLLSLSERDHLQAQQDLEQLLRLNHDDREAYLSLLDCYSMTGNLQRAEELLVQLIHLYPNSVGLRLRCARIIETRVGPGAAIPGLAAALKIAPGNSDVLRSLGLVYHKMGSRNLAIYYINRALALYPGNQWLRRYLEIIRNGKKPPAAPGRQ